MAESEAELKSFLMKVKEESENTGLKLNIQKMKIMASGPATSWQIDGDTMETVTDFIFLRSKISVMVSAARKLKDAFSLEGKLNKPRQCIKKQTSFCQQSLYSQSYGFSSSHVWI